MANLIKEYPKIDWSKDNQEDIQIENYYRLVSSIMKRYSPPRGMDWDDMFQIGVIALIKAHKAFKPDKGIKFSTFAGRCITNEYFMTFRREKSSSNVLFNEAASMDFILSENDDGSIPFEFNLHNLVRDPNTVEDIVFAKIAEEEILDKWEPKNPLMKEVAIYHMEGLRQPIMAEKSGVSQSYVSRLVTVYKKRAAGYFEIGLKRQKKRRYVEQNVE